MREILLMNVTGPDHPGLTAALTACLGQHQVNVLDIGQAVIHDHLDLGMLLEVPDQMDSGPMMKDLLLQAHHHGVKLTFNAIDDDSYEAWVNSQGQPRYIVTLLGRKLNASNISHIAEVAARHGLNIDTISRLSGRISLREENPHERSCVEFSLRGHAADVEQLREELLSLTRDDEVDLAFQADDLYRRNRRLIVFDMDSTLIQCEVMDELAKRAGVGEQVAAITEAAMRGEIDFNQSFEQRLSTLNGLDASVLPEIAATLPITEGADRLIGNLKKLGYKVGILSSGFNCFAEVLKQRWGLDCVSANQLEIVNDKLTGKAVGEIVNGETKARRLQEMASKLGVSMDQTIAVGDGANDLPMLKIAGLGVAFHAKPLVRKSARHAISTLGLDGILYLLGVRDREVV